MPSAELADLKARRCLTAKDLQAAALTADVIKQQRRSAKQLMARGDVTLEELNGIDSAVLTPMFQEQLRLSKKDAAFREMPMQPSEFQFNTPQAQVRFQNWSSSLPQQDFLNNNINPWEPKPQRSFDLWSARQDSPQGKYERHRKNQQSLNTSSMLHQADAKRKKKPDRSNGINLGGMRPLE